MGETLQNQTEALARPAGVPVSIVRLDTPQGLAAVASLPAVQVAAALLTLPTRSARSAVIAALATGQVPEVLRRDAHVFDPVFGRFGDELADGGYFELSAAEYAALKARGLVKTLGNRLVPLHFNPVGTSVTLWGVRNFPCQVRASEAYERLVAVLDSGNDAAWKRAALEAMPAEYWALALLDAEDAEERVTQIAAAAFNAASAVVYWMNTGDRQTLALHVLEERFDWLDAHPATVEVTEGAAALLRRTQEEAKTRTSAVSAKSLIERLRAQAVVAEKERP